MARPAEELAEIHARRAAENKCREEEEQELAVLRVDSPEPRTRDVAKATILVGRFH